MGSQQPRVVVGAALVRAGRVLAARRTRPPAGRWELPGGKVEPGETPEAALEREWREEFGCTIVVERWLPLVVPVDTGLSLRVAVASLAAGDPVATEHDAVRWLTREELSEPAWLHSDRAFLPLLDDALGHLGPAMRGIFADRESADRVANRLLTSGFRADVVRERFAGEDDDEDHAWAVLTDAPEVALDLLVEEFDGWLEVASAAPAARRPAVPPPLPTAPRRIKRP